MGDQQQPFLNRELSLLAFHRRVLEEASRPKHPLLERVKFLSIFSSNMDEFFMIRIAGLKEQRDAGVTQRSPDGRTPVEQLQLIHELLPQLYAQQRRILFEDLLPALRREGIELLDYAQLSQAEQVAVDRYFKDTIFPILTPLAIDPRHPFPHISNLSLNLAVVLRDPDGDEYTARVKIPEMQPRLLPLDQVGVAGNSVQRFVWLEDVITANLADLFPGMTILEAHPFRVTRNADLELQEEEAADLLRTIEQGLRLRRFGTVVRLSICRPLPAHVLALLVDELELEPEDVYVFEGRLGLSCLRELLRLDRPDLKDAPFTPRIPAQLQRHHGDLFEAIRSQDLLLYHPYDSFAPVVELVRQAARDPKVLAIKQTLYRVGRNSPIIEALLEAREHGKQVAVLVELKARFDEEHNIEWARVLERAGVHVAYGLIGLKTHCKLILVVRQEEGQLRRYAHIGTGNYNPTTANLYTDLGLFTCNEAIGADLSFLFNYLTGYAPHQQYEQLLVAPVSLREGLVELIAREMAHQEAGRQGHIIIKVNSLVDPAMIQMFYRAAQAGVRIDLIVRGMCSLRPGVPGLSETIHVRSVVGRFLEHARIYYFHNGGDEQIYFGSADLMERNLNRRVEVLAPILDASLHAYLLEQVLLPQLDGAAEASVLGSDGIYVANGDGVTSPAGDTQAALIKSLP